MCSRKEPHMVAEQSVTATARMLPGNQGGAMASGCIVYFPGWEALKEMPAEDVKRWLLSKEHGDDAQYLCPIQSQEAAPSHRGPGDVQRPRQLSPAVPLYGDISAPPAPFPGMAAADPTVEEITAHALASEARLSDSPLELEDAEDESEAKDDRRVEQPAGDQS